MKKKEQKLVFFDLDGTILGGSLNSENYFLFHLIKNRAIGISQILAAITFMFRWGVKYKRDLLVMNKAYLKNVSEKKIDQLAKNFVCNHLVKKLRSNLIKKVEEHRKNNDIIVLLTGSPKFLAKHFGDYLNIKHIESTELKSYKGFFTADPATKNPYRKEKLKIAKRWCHKHNISMDRCVAYGNSIHDRYLLSVVGKPIAVTPDRKLLQLALKNNWEIIKEE